jgi:ribose transport system substrate-binding protein
MIRLHRLASLAICLSLTLVACGSKPKTSASGDVSGRVHRIGDGATIRLAFVPNAPTAFWEMAAHGLNRFEKETGVHVELKYPPTGSVEEQNQILEDLVNQRYNGVALSVIAPSDQIRDINRATDTINVVTVDSDAPKSARIAFVGPNQREAGAAAGREMVTVLPNGGQIAVFCGDLTAQNAIERMAGIRSAIDGKNIRIVAMKEDGKDRARARAQVEDVLNAYPQIALLVGLWSYNGPAIRDALVASGRTRKIKAVTFDEEPGTLAGIQSGVIEATVVLTPFEYGYRSAQLLYDLARKGETARPADGIINTGYRVVHAGDLTAFKAQLAEQAKW